MTDVLIFLLMLVPLGLLIGAIAGAGPVQYDPMSPHEEREWLLSLGVSEADIDEIQAIPARTKGATDASGTGRQPMTTGPAGRPVAPECSTCHEPLDKDGFCPNS